MIYVKKGMYKYRNGETVNEQWIDQEISKREMNEWVTWEQKIAWVYEHMNTRENKYPHTSIKWISGAADLIWKSHVLSTRGSVPITEH